MSCDLSLCVLHAQSMTVDFFTIRLDSAFVDRADIKQYIGLPPPQAIYWVLQGCLTELMKSGIIRRQVSPGKMDLI